MSTRPILLPALALVALVGATACGSSAVPSPSGSPVAAAPPTAAASAMPSAPSALPPVANDWHGFRGDAGHTGIAPAGPVGQPTVAWQYHAKTAVPRAVAIVGDQVSFASDDGTVYALDRATGTERWVVNVGNAPLIGPWAADGRLYFLNGAGAALAVDAVSGKTLWTSAATYGRTTEPVADRGVLYFGTDSGRIVAIDGATGAEAWSVKPSPSTTWIGNPAVAEGRLYAGTSGGFVAIDLQDHHVAWTGDTHGDQTGSASVNHGIAFIAAGGDAPSTPARAFDAVTGELRWTAAQSGLTFPVAADGTAFSSTMQGLVQALDLGTGAVRWSVQLSGSIRPMAVADHVLYVAADTEQHVYALDVADGRKLWQVDVDGSNDCCVAISGGALYVATLTGTVYSIAGDGAGVATEPAGSTAPTQAPPSQMPVAEVALKVTWSADLKNMGFAPISQIARDPQGRIWAPEAEGNRIAIFDSAGKLVEEWGNPGQFDFTRPNGDGYGTLAFARDGSFFVLDVGNRRVLHFDAKRSLVGQWGSEGEGPGEFSDPVGMVVAADGSVWVLDNGRSIVEHYDSGGTVVGSFDPFATAPNNDGANGLAIDSHGNLYVSAVSPSKVDMFDVNGTLLRTIGAGAFKDQATHMAIDAEGRLFVTQGPGRGSAPGVLVFGVDGASLGGFAPIGTGDGRLTFPAGIVLDGNGSIYVEDSLPETARLVKFELRAALR